VPDPIDDLHASMLARAGDLAHYMLTHGREVSIASGTTANGHPCTVLMAIGWTAEAAAEIGRALLEEVERRNASASDN